MATKKKTNAPAPTSTVDDDAPHRKGQPLPPNKRRQGDSSAMISREDLEAEIGRDTLEANEREAARQRQA